MTDIHHAIKMYKDYGYGSELTLGRLVAEALNTQVDLSSKRMLKDHLCRFNCEQLKMFMGLVIKGRLQAMLFVSIGSSLDLWETLNEKCREKDPTVPVCNTQEYIVRYSKNPYYYFDYLSKKTIVQVFCDHIDKDIKLAEKAAYLFYKTGIEAACNYINAELRRRSM